MDPVVSEGPHATIMRVESKAIPAMVTDRFVTLMCFDVPVREWYSPAVTTPFNYVLDMTYHRLE